MKEQSKKILFTGGGSGGPVSPLLAVADDIGRDDGFEFRWFGTKYGVEREMVGQAGIDYTAIPSGKLRRYFSWKNFGGLFNILFAFIVSLIRMLNWRPDLVMSAGAYVSVPVVWAAWALRIPVIIHQQDVRPGLANKLMARFSNVITVTFKKSLEDYNGNAVWTGNPIRKSVRLRRDRETAIDHFKLDKSKTTILVVGGGTGALALNSIIEDISPELSSVYNTILITGKYKNDYFKYPKKGFWVYDFLDSERMALALDASDIVVSRAGMGLLSELSFLKKASIIIPIPNSHQEDNAAVLFDSNSALVLDQTELKSKALLAAIKELSQDKDRRLRLGENLHENIRSGDSNEIIKIIKNL